MQGKQEAFPAALSTSMMLITQKKRSLDSTATRSAADQGTEHTKKQHVRAKGTEKGTYIGCYFGAILDSAVEDAIERITAGLQKAGLEMETEIGVKDTVKDKLSVAFRNYRIPGACNTSYAYKAQQAESKRVEVSAFDTVASMRAVKTDDLQSIAREMQGTMQEVIETL